MPRARDLAAFGLVAAVLWTGLGSYGLVEPSDARYAETAREMWSSANWLFPKLLGISHFHKPPLIYWLSGAGYTAFGVNEWGARACQGLLGLLLAWTVWRFARKHLDGAAGAWAAVFLVTTPAVIGAERMLTTDLLLVTCQTVALTSAYELWTGTGGSGTRILFYTSMGLAFLAKGPVGWAVPLLVLTGLFLAGRRGEKAAPWGVAWGIPFMLAVALPWFLYVVSRVPGLLEYFVDGQLASRLRSGGMGHPHPWHYYLYVFPALGLPWILAAPEGAKTLLRRNPGAARFLGLWALVPPFFFSLPATKLPLYVLPSYPAIALLAAFAVSCAAPRIRLPLRAAGTLMLATGVAAALVGTRAVPLRGGDLVAVPPAALPKLFLPLAIGWVVAGALALAWTRSGLGTEPAAALSLVAAMAFAVAWAFLHGELLPLRTARPTGQAAAKILRTGDILAEYRTLSAGFAFYAGRIPLLAGIHRDLRFEGPATRARVVDTSAFRRIWDGERRVVVLTTPGHLRELPGAVELARGGGYVLVSNRR